MVKGVNKQIIEVNNPESPYFDRAVFYLKPNVRILPTELSNREIDKLISPYIDHRKMAQNLKRGRIFLYFIIIALTIALAFSIFF